MDLSNRARAAHARRIAVLEDERDAMRKECAHRDKWVARVHACCVWVCGCEWHVCGYCNSMGLHSRMRTHTHRPTPCTRVRCRWLYELCNQAEAMAEKCSRLLVKDRGAPLRAYVDAPGAALTGVVPQQGGPGISPAMSGDLGEAGAAGGEGGGGAAEGGEGGGGGGGEGGGTPRAKAGAGAGGGPGAQEEQHGSRQLLLGRLAVRVGVPAETVRSLVAVDRCWEEVRSGVGCSNGGDDGGGVSWCTHATPQRQW